MEDYGESQDLSSRELKYSSYVDEFRSSLHNMELQLAKTKEDKAAIANKLEEVNEQLDLSQKQIAKAEEDLYEKTRRIKELEFKVENSSKNVPQGSVDMLSIQHELKMRDEQISELKQLLKKKDAIIEKLKTNSHIDSQELKNLNFTVNEKSRKNYELKTKTEENLKKLDSLAFAKRNEGTLLVEIEHYKADNARLVELLKSTAEFGAFSSFAEASEGVRYLPRSTKAPIKADNECDDWVPSESWRMVKDFLAKYGEKGFKSVQINRLLEDLNAIWRRREKNLMNQVRSKCNRELEKLRRQLANAPPFDQFLAEKEKTRLKGDLRKAYEDLRAVSSASVRAIARPHGFL